MNLPTTPIRDLVIHGADLVAATHGRSFWILDDVTPLREASEQVENSPAYLFKPETAYRVRPGSDEGTPLPAEIPAGENPPDGASIDYYLKTAAAGPVTLEIFDSSGKLVRRYSSAERIPPLDPKQLDIPAAWVHPPEPLSAAAGMHRFVWDLHYPGAGGGRRGGLAALAAMFGFGGGPWAVPGDYTVKLTVTTRITVGAEPGYDISVRNTDVKVDTWPLIVKMDPRVKVSQADLQKQFDFTQQVLARTAEVNAAAQQAAALQKRLQEIAPQVASPKDKKLADTVDELDKRVSALLGKPPAGELGGTPEPTDRTTLRYVSGALGQVERVVESDDAAPSADASAAFAQDDQIAQAALQKWEAIVSTDLPALNKELHRAKIEPIELGMQRPAPGEN